MLLRLIAAAACALTCSSFAAAQAWAPPGWFAAEVGETVVTYRRLDRSRVTLTYARYAGEEDDPSFQRRVIAGGLGNHFGCPELGDSADLDSDYAQNDEERPTCAVRFARLPDGTVHGVFLADDGLFWSDAGAFQQTLLAANLILMEQWVAAGGEGGQAPSTFPAEQWLAFMDDSRKPVRMVLRSEYVGTILLANVWRHAAFPLFDNGKGVMCARWDPSFFTALSPTILAKPDCTVFSWREGEDGALEARTFESVDFVAPETAFGETIDKPALHPFDAPRVDLMRVKDAATAKAVLGGAAWLDALDRDDVILTADGRFFFGDFPFEHEGHDEHPPHPQSGTYVLDGHVAIWRLPNGQVFTGFVGWWGEPPSATSGRNTDLILNGFEFSL